MIIAQVYCMFVSQKKLQFLFGNECSRAVPELTAQVATTTKKTALLATVNARFDMQYFNFCFFLLLLCVFFVFLLRFGYLLAVSNYIFSLETIIDGMLCMAIIESQLLDKFVA